MLTLNIEENSLRMTVIKGKRVTVAVENPLPAGAVVDGVVKDKQAVSEIIKSVLQKHAIYEKEVLACVSGTHSIYRVVSVPKLDRKLLSEVSRKEMERVSPVPLHTLYISWQEVRTAKDEAQLCLMGVPHDNVDSVVDTIVLSGLRAKSVELKPLVIARVVENKTAITINIQHNGFDITIVDNMIPQMIRNLSFPGENLTEAEKINAIKEELSRTVSFYNSSHTDSRLTENTFCYLSGIVSGDLIRQLGYLVRPLPEPLTYPEGIDILTYVANTGLALGVDLKAVRWVKVAFNLLQGAAVERKTPKYSAAPILAIIVGLCIIVAIFMINSVVVQETARLKNLVDEKNRQVNDLQKTLREDRDKIIKQRDELKTGLNQLKAPLEEAGRSRENINRNVGKTIAAMPGIMYLTSIGYTKDVITLSGLAPDADAVMNYARSLRQSGLFNLVTITSLSSKSYNDTRFTLTLIPNK